ncbi:hypothetical protein CYMTET_23480, partial [Cymbomonas tetramitiformis]
MSNPWGDCSIPENLRVSPLPLFGVKASVPAHPPKRISRLQQLDKGKGISSVLLEEEEPSTPAPNDARHTEQQREVAALQKNVAEVESALSPRGMQLQKNGLPAGMKLLPSLPTGFGVVNERHLADFLKNVNNGIGKIDNTVRKHDVELKRALEEEGEQQNQKLETLFKSAINSLENLSTGSVPNTIANLETLYMWLVQKETDLEMDDRAK